MFRQFDSPETLRRCLDVVRPALLLGPRGFLSDVHGRLHDYGVPAAVRAHVNEPIFDWIMAHVSRQGISNAAADVYTARHGNPRWAEIDTALAAPPTCPKLRSYWHFSDCRYRKNLGTCARSDHLPRCPVPRAGGRKGLLSEAAFGLRLFVRDVAGDELVDWIDSRLADADPGRHAPDRAIHMRVAVLKPFSSLPGFGPKVAAMILSELLLGADPDRERWATTGASMIAVDSLIHNLLHRTGVLRRLGTEHRYGRACAEPGGCVDVIEALSQHIDAREFGGDYPPCFPRWIQFSLWRFASAICNGNRIDYREQCEQRYCPAFQTCEKIVIKPCP